MKYIRRYKLVQNMFRYRIQISLRDKNFTKHSYLIEIDRVSNKASLLYSFA